MIIPLEHVVVKPLCLLSLCLRGHLTVTGNFFVRLIFIQECFNVEKSHMSWLSRKLVSVFQTDLLQVLFYIYSEITDNDLYCRVICNNLFDCCTKQESRALFFVSSWCVNLIRVFLHDDTLH